MGLTLIPLRVVSDTDLRQCERKGACCDCSACCWAFDVEDVPVADGAPGTMKLDASGKPVTYTKPGGEYCPHLQIRPGDEGRFGCAIYDSPHKPSACGTWVGHQRGNYKNLLYALFLRATQVPHGLVTVMQLKLLIQTNAVGLLRGNPFDPQTKDKPSPESILASTSDFILAITRYVWTLNVFDEEIFTFLGISPFLEAVRRDPRSMRKIVTALKTLRFDPDIPAHRTFIETYFEPHEQAEIWR
jgi:hypothetical protein